MLHQQIGINLSNEISQQTKDGCRRLYPVFNSLHYIYEAKMTLRGAVKMLSTNSYVTQTLKNKLLYHSNTILIYHPDRTAKTDTIIIGHSFVSRARPWDFSGPVRNLILAPLSKFL
jgi:hypothetical protein